MMPAKPSIFRDTVGELEAIFNAQAAGPQRTRGIILCRQLLLTVQDQEIEIGRESLQRGIAEAERNKLTRVRTACPLG